MLFIYLIHVIYFIFPCQYHIKCKSKICLDLEINQDKLKKEKIRQGSFPNNVVELKDQLDEKYIYEDFIIFQYLTTKKPQKFCIEFHYHIPYIILKENKYIFQVFNNLKRQNQQFIHCRDLYEIENNLLDKIKEGKIQYNEIEMKDNVYYINFFFDELKMYKSCLFLFNKTKIPANWVINDEEMMNKVDNQYI